MQTAEKGLKAALYALGRVSLWILRGHCLRELLGCLPPDFQEQLTRDVSFLLFLALTCFVLLLCCGEVAVDLRTGETSGRWTAKGFECSLC